MAAMSVRCPNCDGEATTVREIREVPLGLRRVVIEDEFMRCGGCGEEFFSRAQADRSHHLAVEHARLEDNLLPSQIKDVRESIALTQAQFRLSSKTFLALERRRAFAGKPGESARISRRID